MKKILTILIFSSAGLIAEAQNPYAIFGYEPKSIYPQKNISEMFTIPNADSCSAVKKLVFDFESGFVYLLSYGDMIADTVDMDDLVFMRWMSVDPLSNGYPSASPYSFVLNSPIQAVDPDGQKVLFVNGYYNTGSLSGLAGDVGGEDYWSYSFINAASTFLNDANSQFIDGRGEWNSSGASRYDDGYAWAQTNYSGLIEGVLDENGVQTETFKVVSHSMGAAYSEGVVKYLEEQGLVVETVLHFSAADPTGFEASTNPDTYQLNYENDIVLGYKNYGENSSMIEGVDVYGSVNTPGNKLSDYENSHARTKSNSDTFDALSDLQNIQMNFVENVDFGPLDYTWGTYKSSGTTNGTDFNVVSKGGTTYYGSSGADNYDGPPK